MNFYTNTITNSFTNSFTNTIRSCIPSTFSLIPYIPYVFLVFIIILLLFAGYIKFKYRFWSVQPVFHFYDFHYSFYPYGIIMRELPEKNRYCNFKQIKTIEFSKMDDHLTNKFVNFVKHHYLKNGDNVFDPARENVIPYFIGHNAPCFFTHFEEDELLYDTKDSNTIAHKKMVSVMTSRPIHIYFNKKGSTANFDLYYVDYLCVDPLFRKKGIAPQIIQTHEYNQRHSNKSIAVSLFKRETELTGIVPLCTYFTYGFSMKKWCVPSEMPEGNINVVECGPNNIHHLVDFLKSSLSEKFDVCITPEISNILELVKTKNIYIYMVIQDDDILACYYFRDLCTSLKKSTMSIICFASVNYCKNIDIFIHGFKIAISKICLSIKDNKKKFGYALIEDISDNAVLIQNIQMKTPYMMKNPTAYFLYNYIYPTVPSGKIFILN